MNVTKTTTLVTALSLLIALAAQAHDPSLHKKKTESPRCEALAKMDSSQANSAIMKALQKKCQAEKSEEHHDDGGYGDGHGQQGKEKG